jgi:hypothetical protein
MFLHYTTFHYTTLQYTTIHCTAGEENGESFLTSNFHNLEAEAFTGGAADTGEVDVVMTGTVCVCPRMCVYCVYVKNVVCCSLVRCICICE